MCLVACCAVPAALLPFSYGLLCSHVLVVESTYITHGHHFFTLPSGPPLHQMSGSEELAQAEEEGLEGGEDYEGNEDDQELAKMHQELANAEQQKAELDKLNKMQGTASADSKQSQCASPMPPPCSQPYLC